MKFLKTIFLLLIVINCFGQNRDVETEIISDNNLFEASIIQVYPDAFPSISVVFQSKNKAGKPLWLLNKNEIGIKENGKDCEVICLKNISEKKGLNIGIVLDHSGSMSGRKVYTGIKNSKNKTSSRKNYSFDYTPGPIDYAKEGISEFLKTENSDQDSMLVVGFASRVDKVIDLTTDYKKVRATINKIQAGGGTAFFDALYTGIDKLSKSNNPRSVIVGLTDGVDNSSKKTHQQVIKYANEQGISIYIIGLGNVNTNVLKKLSDQTSGFYYHTNSAKALGNIYANIKEQIKSIYQLDYLSNNFEVDQIERELSFYFKNDTMAFADNAAFFDLSNQVQQYVAYQNAKRINKPSNNNSTNNNIILGGMLCSLLIGMGSFTLFQKRNKKPVLTIKKAYPNPFDNFVTVNLDLANTMLKTELQLVSMDGRIVKTKVLDPAVDTYTIYTSSLASGLYSLQLVNKDGVSKIENIVKK